MKSAMQIGTICAAVALVMQPASAAAQQCLAEDEVSAMAIYAMPSLVEGVRLRCTSQLRPAGFIARGGAALGSRYAKLQPAVWPKAKSGLLKIAARKSANGQARTAGAGDNLQMLATLPDNAVRPLVDALITQEIGPQIALKNCGRIELLMQALSKVDPEIAGTLLGLIAGLVKLDEPAICETRV